ncbi:hypothetical protein DFJ77DRAFT_511987 [Powellomyces hirtus]|nr:hypothetical protein DFJ77DRAFT_511987 [Powellomyces hirtus]
MTSAEEDYYGLLEVPYGATDAQIRKAYRKRALKFHPDKVGPDDAKAAHMFHLLSVASDTLSDPAKRSVYDSLYKARIAQKRKLDAMDASLRQARSDLEAREGAAKRAKDTGFAAAVQRRNEIDRLREEGLKKAQAAEEQRRQMSTAHVQEAVREAMRHRVETAASVADCTVRAKWKTRNVTFTVADLQNAFGRYGKVDKVIMNSKGKGSAMVVFESIFDAQSAIRDQYSKHLRDLQLSWANGSEPSCLSTTHPATPPPPSSTPTSQPQPSAKPPPPPKPAPTPASHPQPIFTPGGFDDDYEVITLMKMRQAAADKASLAT